jgi:hypothetical protein
MIFHGELWNRNAKTISFENAMLWRMCCQMLVAVPDVVPVVPQTVPAHSSPAAI